MQTQVWTRDEIKYRLSEAADTLRRMPSNGMFPSKRMCMSIEVLQDSFDAWIAYDRTNPPKVRLAAASNEAITHLDETLTWLGWLSIIQRKIIWARAMPKPFKPTWRELEDQLGSSERAIRGWHSDALDAIGRRLNQHLVENIFKTSIASFSGKCDVLS